MQAISVQGRRLSSTIFFCPGCLETLGNGETVCTSCGYTRPDTGWPADSYLGRTINKKYLLKRRLGAGGFAQVFLAEQLQEGIELGEVVLKFLHQSMAAHQSVRRRFINEARAARKIRSPHAVKVFDLGFDEDGTPYMVMEYLEGDNLDQLLAKEGTLTPQRVFNLGLQVAGALEECHNIGIIHRDLKPDNLLILLGRHKDFVKVLDFGIARVPQADGTLTHTLMGTPRYMPPEQILQQEMDGGVDIFALGVILYECLTGRAPIPATTPMEYLKLNVLRDPIPLREVRRDLPEDLEQLLSRMMAKERADRPNSMADVEQRLRAIGLAHGWVARPSGEMRVASPIGEGDTLSLREASVPGAGDPGAAVDAHGATQAVVTPLQGVIAEASSEEGPDTVKDPVQPDAVSGPVLAAGPETRRAERELYGSGLKKKLMLVVLFLLLGAGVGGVMALTRSRSKDEQTPQASSARTQEVSTSGVTPAAPPAVASTASALAHPAPAQPPPPAVAQPTPAPAALPPSVRVPLAPAALPGVGSRPQAPKGVHRPAVAATSPGRQPSRSEKTSRKPKLAVKKTPQHGPVQAPARPTVPPRPVAAPQPAPVADSEEDYGDRAGGL